MKKSLLIIPLLLAGCAKVATIRQVANNAIQSLAIWLIALMLA